MATELDVGSGGDVADWDEMTEYLFDNSPISDDYTFNQISDITQTTFTVRGINTSGSPTIECNGNGFTTILDDVSGIRLHNASITDTVFIAHDLIIHMTGATGGSGISAIAFTGRTSLGTKIYNCFIYSSETPGAHESSGIGPQCFNSADGTYSYWNVYNCILYNLHQGIEVSASSNGTTNKRYIENCSLFNCGFTFNENTGYALRLDNKYVQYRNIYTLRNDGITGHDVGYINSTSTATNCATTDATTYADIEAAYPGMTTDCLDDLTASEHLISTTFGSSKFLKPKKYSGTGIYNGGTTPITPTHDYDGIEYGLGGLYPIGAYQYIKQLKSRIIGVV